MSLDKAGKGTLDKAYTPKRIPADYIVDGSNPAHILTYDKSGQILTDIANATTALAWALNNVPERGTVVAKGAISLPSTLVLDGSVMVAKNFEFDFDSLEITADQDVLDIQNCLVPFKIVGKALINSVNNSSHILLNIINTNLGDISIGLMKGPASGGVSAIEMQAGAGQSLMCNKIKLRNNLQLRTVLFVNLTGNGWGNCNDIDLGYFEGQSPAQIYIAAAGTGSWGQNIICGVGGATTGFNPLSLPQFVISLDVSGGTGSTIYGQTFRDFFVFSATDKIYVSTAGGGGIIKGTRFIGGMPRQDATAFYHAMAGDVLEFISCYVPDLYDQTILATQNSGTSTGTGAQQTIPHGLPFTPTYTQVFLSERSTGGALARQSAVPDATNIYITATNAKDYNWRVALNP